MQKSACADGSLTWSHDREAVTRQFARNWWQRVQDVFFMAFSRDLYGAGTIGPRSNPPPAMQHGY